MRQKEQGEKKGRDAKSKMEQGMEEDPDGDMEKGKEVNEGKKYE